MPADRQADRMALAAQQLRRFGHRVVVLEAQARIGGRVLTEEIGGAKVDMGAMLLVGTLGNPLVTLCEQTGCRTHTLDRSTCPLYDGGGALPAEVDASAEGRFNKMMDSYHKDPEREDRSPDISKAIIDCTLDIYQADRNFHKWLDKG